jgi:hypothetical protein
MRHIRRKIGFPLQYGADAGGYTDVVRYNALLFLYSQTCTELKEIPTYTS